MSLPPGFLDELRSRISLAQVVGRKVMWDQRKSNQGRGDMWAPCPFHQEKTASFHVDDRKGYYYCFGCHAKGDMISFVRETENVGFMEAVEILAGEAGMQMPARDPQAQEKADRRSELTDIMEQALRFYRLQLRRADGAAAREYLAGRGLTDDALERWAIGFAPDAWRTLWDHLRGQGVAEQAILAVGLARKPSSGEGQPYDTFRNRILFPIRDARGRCIAFGGRAMDPGDNAKYINSPETELFDKGRTLYNHGPAREASGKGVPLIVAEGYMDVIALCEAGFGATVAPLGTAVTEDQLRLLWRMHPEPVIALDGDEAGLKAAMRVMDLALPLIEAGQSLRFAMLPHGHDPDSLLRAEGPAALQQALERALPMVQILWRRETEGRAIDSPERRAALDKTLRDALGRIRDPSIREHYKAEIRGLRRTLFRQPDLPRGPRAGGAGGGFPGRRLGTAPATPVPATRSSLLAAGPGSVEDHLREAVILATLVTHPVLVEQFAAEIEALQLVLQEHERVRAALLRTDEPDAIREIAGPEAIEKLFAPRHVRIAPGVRADTSAEIAAQCVHEELRKLNARRGIRREIEDAVRDLEGVADEGLTWRLGQAADAVSRADRSETDDGTEYTIGPNGLRIRLNEKDAFRELVERIEFQRNARNTNGNR